MGPAFMPPSAGPFGGVAIALRECPLILIGHAPAVCQPAAPALGAVFIAPEKGEFADSLLPRLHGHWPWRAPAVQ